MLVSDRMDAVMYNHEQDFGHLPRALELTTDEFYKYRTEVYKREGFPAASQAKVLPAGAADVYKGLPVFVSRGVRL